MKKTLSSILAIACLLGAASVKAQTGPPSSSNGKPAGRQMPKMGKLYGKLVDSKTGKGISDASVSLMQTRDGKNTLIQGTLTSGNGEFSLENLPMMGQFELLITSLGYKEYKQPVAFDMAALMKAGSGMRSPGEGGGMPDGTGAMLNASNKDLGNIRLEQVAQSLEGVTVSSKTPSYSLQGEKKIFNVEQNLTSQGGTAADVMKNVPGVSVDPDNNVTLRNAAPQILVDGRPTPLQLTQIPADAISTVEVITNPSAKYDAEGGGTGVINIVLKKNRRQGYNGSVRTSIDSRGGASLGGDFSVRRGKVNLTFTGQSMLSRSLGHATTQRTDFYSTPDQYTLQNETNTSKGAFGFGWLGLDYFVTNRTTISVGGMMMHANAQPENDIDITTDSLYNTGIKSAWATRSTNGENTYKMNSGQLNIKHLFPRSGREWTLDATANSGKSGYNTGYNTTQYQNADHTGTGTDYQQQTVGSGANQLYVLQSDYTDRVGTKGKMDVGVKGTIRNLENNISNQYYDEEKGSFIEIPNPNSDFKSHEVIYAAYGSYSGNINDNNSFQVGLRAESSNYTGTLNNVDSSFSIQYPVSLFPTLSYTHKMKHDQQLQFSFRRGINRPTFFQLLPYADYTDPLNIRQGNPALRPEFTNNVELNYMKSFSKTNYVLVSLYERHTENLITTYQSVGTNPFTGSDAIITSYANANSSDKYGVEITSGWDLKKWWTITANANLYNGHLNTGETSDYISGFGKLNNQFKFQKGWSAQLSGTYQSRTNMLPDGKGQGYAMMGGGRGMGPQTSTNAQGYLGAYWFADMSIRKAFLKNDAASLSLTVSDIFGTRRYIQHSESEFFVQDYNRLINPTLFRLNFSWRFGKMDMDAMRRKNFKGQMEGMQDASQSMGM